MKKKSAKKPYKPTLQTFELVPVTDPAVIAAFEEMRKQENPVVPQILRDHARMVARTYSKKAKRASKSRAKA